MGFRYAGREMLREVVLHVPSGGVLGVLGRSGSGKSTLLRLLAGVLPDGEGSVLLDAQPLSAAQRRGRGGFVPQKPGLLPWRTVLQNIALPLELHGIGAAARAERARELAPRYYIVHVNLGIAIEDDVAAARVRPVTQHRDRVLLVAGGSSDGQAAATLAGLLADKQIPHELDLWGHDSAHDWPWWQPQLAHHISRFC